MLSIRRSSRLEGKDGDVQGPVERFRALIFALLIPFPLLNLDELVCLLRAFFLSRNYREACFLIYNVLECMKIIENGNLLRKRIHLIRIKAYSF